MAPNHTAQLNIAADDFTEWSLSVGEKEIATGSNTSPVIALTAIQAVCASRKIDTDTIAYVMTKNRTVKR